MLCDINGERHRSEELGFVALRMSRAKADFADYEAPADSWGDIGAASGIFLSAMVTQRWARGYRSPGAALVMTGSDGGARGAAVLVKEGAA